MVLDTWESVGRRAFFLSVDIFISTLLILTNVCVWDCDMNKVIELRFSLRVQLFTLDEPPKGMLTQSGFQIVVTVLR